MQMLFRRAFVKWPCGSRAAVFIKLNQNIDLLIGLRGSFTFRVLREYETRADDLGNLRVAVNMR